MKTMVDVTCGRCGCTTSGWWLDPTDLAASHTCPDGGTPATGQLSTSERIVPGPGERGSDREPAPR